METARQTFRSVWQPVDHQITQRSVQLNNALPVQSAGTALPGNPQPFNVVTNRPNQQTAINDGSVPPQPAHQRRSQTNDNATATVHRNSTGALAIGNQWVSAGRVANTIAKASSNPIRRDVAVLPQTVHCTRCGPR